MIRNNTYSLQYLLVVYILFYFTWKFIQFVPGFSILGVGIALLCLMLGKRVISINKRMVALIVYLCLTMIIYFAFINNNRYWNVIDNSIKMILMLLFADIFDSFDYGSKLRFVKIVLIGYVVTNISTLINAIIDPEIIRATAYTSVDSHIVLGIGGYDYIYGLVVVNILVVSMLLLEKNVKNRTLLILFVILNFFTLTMSGFTTVTILSLVFLAISFAFSSRFRGMVATIIGVISYANLSKILLFIADISFLPEILKERIKEFALYTLGSSRVMYYWGSEGSRGARIERSWNIFLRNPLTGGFITSDIEGLGEHSEWIDRLAEFGLLIVAAIIIFWIFQYKYCLHLSNRRKSFRYATHLSFLYFLILGFFNPCSYQGTVFPLLVIMPCFFSIYNNEAGDYLEVEDESSNYKLRI